MTKREAKENHEYLMGLLARQSIAVADSLISEIEALSHSVDTYLADITRSIWHLESLAVRTDSQQELYLVLLLEYSRVLHRHDVNLNRSLQKCGFDAYWFCDR